MGVEKPRAGGGGRVSKAGNIRGIKRERSGGRGWFNDLPSMRWIKFLFSDTLCDRRPSPSCRDTFASSIAFLRAEFDCRLKSKLTMVNVTAMHTMARPWFSCCDLLASSSSSSILCH